jgi:hypothetical protein
VGKVLGWIARGELAAINIASTLAMRPRWVVKISDLEAFEQQRASLAKTVGVSRQQRGYRKKRSVAQADFF